MWLTTCLKQNLTSLVPRRFPQGMKFPIVDIVDRLDFQRAKAADELTPNNPTICGDMS